MSCVGAALTGVLLLAGVPAPALAAEWHVGPDGRATAAGTGEDPWDLQTALSGGGRDTRARIQPGDTVWLHGGTYRGGFESGLTGTEDAPILVRQRPGERATIDCRPRDDRDTGTFLIRGAHALYQGFELTCSDPKRVTETGGSWPADIRRGSVDCRGANIRLVNLVVHDLSSGIASWSEAPGGEISGCLIYHNGWKGPDRGHGHAVYAQNRSGTKHIVDNIAFNQFGSGLHCYGSERAHLNGFHLEGNICFNNGCLTQPGERTTGILVGGGTPVRGLSLVRNYTWGGGVRCGYPWGVPNEDAVIAGNYVADGLYVRDFARATVTGNTIFAESSLGWFEASAGRIVPQVHWDENRYFRTALPWSAFVLRLGEKQQGLDFPEWQQASGFDARSTFTVVGRDAPATEGQPSAGMPDAVFVRANRHEAGRANVVVYNWSAADTVAVNLGAVLRPGQRFRIVSAQNFFGPAVLEGTFDGAHVRLPMLRTAPAQPVGMDDHALPATEPRFGAFVVLPE
jgi:hypothetical protein